MTDKAENSAHKKFATALLNAGSENLPAASSFDFDRVTKADRHRVRELTVLTGFLWVATIATMGWLIWFGWGIVSSISRQPELPEPVKTHFLYLGSLVVYGFLLATLSIVFLVLAGLSSLFLMHRLRVATLNQIRISLAQITEQLRDLHSKSDPDDE